MPKSKPFHLKKQLETAYNQGFYDGYIDACNIWEEVASHTKGVGPILQQRMNETVRNIATQMALEKMKGD